MDDERSPQREGQPIVGGRSSTEDSAQLALWRGSFGSDYIARNTATEVHVRNLLPLWKTILGHTTSAPVESILEVGSNVGLNLRALRLMTDARLFAVEPNDHAREALLRDRVLDPADIRAGAAAAIDFPDKIADMAFTSCVLIHIHPGDLLASCSEIHRCASRWIACIEYFADQPETKSYRGHEDVLFKRDFGSFWLDHFPDLSAVAYGFFWKRISGLDNVTWWLFKKS